MRPGEVIEARIRNRTCSRKEWHALRRHRGRRARGLPSYEYGLTMVVMVEDFRRGMQAFVRSCRRRPAHVVR